MTVSRVWSQEKDFIDQEKISVKRRSKESSWRGEEEEKEREERRNREKVIKKRRRGRKRRGGGRIEEGRSGGRWERK
jgi:hypothetical protein